MAGTQNNHTCILCGAAYYACDDCSRVKSYTAWRTVCCSRQHYLIYMVLKSYQAGLTDAETACKELVDLGISREKTDEWTEGAKHLLAEIFAQTISSKNR